MNGSFSLTKANAMRTTNNGQPNSSQTTQTTNFFTEQLALLLKDNYQAIYDCFFQIVKERQVKQNAQMSDENSNKHQKQIMHQYAINSSDQTPIQLPLRLCLIDQSPPSSTFTQNLAARNNSTSPLLKQDIDPKGNSFSQVKNNKDDQQCMTTPNISAYNDSLYFPSTFFKHKGAETQENLKKKAQEYEFRNLVQNLSSKFFGQICQNSPYLESIVSDLEALNSMVTTNHLKYQGSIKASQASSFQAQLDNIKPAPNIGQKEGANQSSSFALQITVKGGLDDNQQQLQQPQVQIERLEKKLMENEKLQNRVKELDQVANKLRKDYYKDLVSQNLYKMAQETNKIKPRSKSNNGGTSSGATGNSANNSNIVPVEYFDVLMGVDPEILGMINAKLADMKDTCDKKIQDQAKYQESLVKKIQNFNKLSPNAFSLINLSMEDIIKGLAAIDPNPQVLWDAIHQANGQDYFLFIIEKEYGSKFSKDYSQMNSDIDKIQDEASFQIKEVLNKSQKEIVDLRRVVDEKNQEMNQLKESQIKEIEKAQRDSFLTAEIQFRQLEAKIFNKYDAEKQELYEKIGALEEVNTNFDHILTQSSMKFSLMKLAFTTQLRKVVTKVKELAPESSQLCQVLDKTLDRIFDILQGKTSMEIDRVKREYENDMKNVMNENNAYSMEIQERKMREQQINEKIVYLEQCLDDAQEEAQMHKSRVDSMYEENRKLAGEHDTLNRALKNSQKLCEGLEAEKARMEYEIQKIAGNNATKYQSALAEAELHRKKALNQISNAGANSLQTMYGSTKQTKGTMTYLKDVACEITLTKKKTDGGDMILTNNKQKMKEPKETQTDDDVVVMTGEEYVQLLQNGGGGGAAGLCRSNSRSSRMSRRQTLNGVDSEKLIGGVRRRVTGLNGDIMNEQDEFSSDYQDAEIQCNLINANGSPGRGYNDSLDYLWTNDMNVTVQDWNNKYNLNGSASLFNRPFTHFKHTDGLKMPNLSDLPDVYRRLYLDMFEKASRYERLKQEFDRIRSDAWAKKDQQKLGTTKNSKKQKNTIHKDPMTGKVFINLIELYKDSHVQQLLGNTNKGVNSANRSPIKQERLYETHQQQQNQMHPQQMDLQYSNSNTPKIYERQKSEFNEIKLKQQNSQLSHLDESKSANKMVYSRQSSQLLNKSEGLIKRSISRGTNEGEKLVSPQRQGVTVATQTDSLTFNFKQMGIQFNKVQGYTATNAASALSFHQQDSKSLSKSRYEQTQSSQGLRTSHYQTQQHQPLITSTANNSTNNQNLLDQEKAYTSSKEKFSLHQQSKQRRNLYQSLADSKTKMANMSGIVGGSNSSQNNFKRNHQQPYSTASLQTNITSKNKRFNTNIGGGNVKTMTHDQMMRRGAPDYSIPLKKGSILNQSSENLGSNQMAGGKLRGNSNQRSGDSNNRIFEIPISLLQSQNTQNIGNGNNQYANNEIELSSRRRSKHSSQANSSYRIYLNEPKVRISRQLNL